MAAVAEVASDTGTQLWSEGGGSGVRCPRVVAFKAEQASNLTLSDLKVTVDIHIAVAFVRIEGVWSVNAEQEGAETFVFELPTRHTTTVTSASLLVDAKRAFDTMVVEANPALGAYKEREGRGMAMAMALYRERSGRDPGSYDPELFAVPFHGMQKAVRVTVDYVETLRFSENSYSFHLPLSFAPGVTAKGKRVEDIVGVRVAIDTGTAESRWDCASHPMVVVDDDRKDDGKSKRILLQTDSKASYGNKDFEITYNTWSPDILCNALYESPVEGSADKRSTLCCFIAPPNKTNPSAAVAASPRRKGIADPLKTHARDVVFILDRSGSMGFTHVMESAKDALLVGLNQLSSQDRFAVCAFDHRQIWFQGPPPPPPGSATPSVTDPDMIRIVLEAPPPPPGAPQEQRMDPPRGPILFPANEKNLAAARRWLSYVDAGGLTDIMTPVQHALKLFDAAHLSKRAQLPIVFLITDGAVENEREICAIVEKAAKEQNARFFAFGIGTACNAYFLRMMASIGRGYSDVCLTLPPKPDAETGMLKAAAVETVRGGVKTQMAALLAHARTPLLTDVSIDPEKAGALGVLELWPETTPDLYGGAPVLVCGKFTSDTPTSLVVRGNLPGSFGSTRHVGDVDDPSSSAPSSREWKLNVPLEKSRYMPLNKVFAKMRLEQLIAQSWLHDVTSSHGKKLQRECVSLAVEESLPCPYTQMVAFETTPEEMEARRAAPPGSSKSILPKGAKRGMVFLGAAVVGVAAFGSIAATLGDGGGILDAVAGGGDCGECCGEGCGDGCDGCDGCDCLGNL